jgi:hypothetical protein
MSSCLGKPAGAGQDTAEVRQCRGKIGPYGQGTAIERLGQRDIVALGLEVPEIRQGVRILRRDDEDLILEGNGLFDVTGLRDECRHIEEGTLVPWVGRENALIEACRLRKPSGTMMLECGGKYCLRRIGYHSHAPMLRI